MPPRKKPSTGPTPVEAITHSDKRANLPTADAQEFVTPEVEKIPRLPYRRDPSLDPQLVWKGKDEQDGEDLIVDAPPIYIQEKIDPRALIENLRATAKAGVLEPELMLFDAFDGLGDLDLVDFYKHEANWSNRMILGDSLQVMASLAEREAHRGKVQMIYIDPPYGIRFGSNWQVTVSDTSVEDGKSEDVAREVEIIKAFRDTWELGIHSYLSYLRDRMTVARELLTESGSLFFQINDANQHLVRGVLDEVFGSDCHVVTILIKKKGDQRSSLIDPVNDYVHWYSRVPRSTGRVKFRPVFEDRPMDAEVLSVFSSVEMPDGTTCKISKVPLPSGDAVDYRVRPAQLIKDFPGARLFSSDPLTVGGFRRNQSVEYSWDGVAFSPSRNLCWKHTARSDDGSPCGMDRIAWSGRLIQGQSTWRFKRYFDDFPYTRLGNWWDSLGGQGDPVYVVQTNTEIVKRCMLMTTDPGDLVLDPTCGSGTTAFVAEHWGRRWITIDSSRVAVAIARTRLMAGSYPYFLLADSVEGAEKEAELVGQQASKQPFGNDIRQGFVLQRRSHITSSVIANNPDISVGMTQAELDAAILKHSDIQLFVDRPYVDATRVRVAGPMTVESLSPHRSLAFAMASGMDGQQSPDETGSSFERLIMENLRTSGIQNGRRRERLEFETLDTHGGEFIQAVGDRSDAPDGPKRVGIAIGPQYGTVGPTFIKSAAREAIRAKDIDLLCVLAFAFDPQSIGASDDYVSGDEGFDVAAERSLGRVPVLLVRMNADLLMGEDLKKTGAGNLFTVFGEPDIEWELDDGRIVVELRGVDVYDPTTGEIRSNSTDQIALWMIDTNYNEESFFVRHCYFTGGGDPYKRLKTALKSDIDEEAWASLYRTVSRSFDRPETGKIAVKVINDYGDEVMKVFEV